MSAALPPAPTPPAPAAHVRVRVGRVVLDGVDLAPGERVRFHAALEAELVRLLTEGGVPPALAGGGAYPRLRAGAPVDASAGAAALGGQVARAVYGGIGG